jgi:hypothetical protein
MTDQAARVTGLAQQTPAEIDFQLADIWDRFYTARDKRDQHRKWLTQIVERQEEVAAGTYRGFYTATEAKRDAETVARMEAKIAWLAAAALTILEETVPFDSEHVRRNGWTRAYLVDNNGGHVHTSMNCRTCFPTTRFNWLPQVSGWTEAQVLAEAGNSACSVCYPTGRVKGKRNANLLDRPDRIAEREARAAAKAEREAKKAAKAGRQQTGRYPR